MQVEPSLSDLALAEMQRVIYAPPPSCADWTRPLPRRMRDVTPPDAADDGRAQP